MELRKFDLPNGLKGHLIEFDLFFLFNEARYPLEQIFLELLHTETPELQSLNLFQDHFKLEDVSLIA
jgi:hypothetical protein